MVIHSCLVYREYEERKVTDTHQLTLVSIFCSYFVSFSDFQCFSQRKVKKRAKNLKIPTDDRERFTWIQHNAQWQMKNSHTGNKPSWHLSVQEENILKIFFCWKWTLKKMRKFSVLVSVAYSLWAWVCNCDDLV